MQMTRYMPVWAWRILRVGSVATALWLCYTLYTQPELGLTLFWGLAIPILPLVFFVAPGLWRNLCPLSASNQVPRVLRFSLALTPPAWFKEYAYVIGLSMFFLLVSMRKLGLDTDGIAVAALIVGALVFAFLGGFVFQGKSGWCSSVCPLLPVQQLYGQTPFIMFPNSHCQPCLGCTKNCYDFNPHVAYLADQYDDDIQYAAYRKFFVAAFPGFILAFYQIPNPPTISLSAMYTQFGTYMLLSVGSFFVLDSLLKVSSVRITTIYAVIALNLFYWFSAPVMAQSVGTLSGVPIPIWAAWPLQAVIAIVSILWVRRTYRNERLFIQEITPPTPVRVDAKGSRALERASSQAEPAVTFSPEDVRVLVQPGRSLLEVAEANNMQIEAGCRMGVCGSDPVNIIGGMENLTAASADELSTIERLGLGANTRMACCARVKGDVELSLRPDRSAAPRKSIQSFAFDRNVKSVVIIGNGIAGITTADHIRRRHPDCKIHVIGRERYHLYNRMAITRLIYGRSAMQGLTLMPESWYDDREINCWLNTRAVGIDRKQRCVHLGVGGALEYDRLILAMGSTSFVPTIHGIDMPGAFVVREAEDAMHIREFVQEHGCRQAVVAGGGLLGLEAAFGMHQLGLDVAVLERGEWLLRRQLDATGAGILQNYLEGLGIGIDLKAEASALRGDKRVHEVRLKSNQQMRCDVFLACAGITPNIGLAKDAGLASNRGVVVDDHMRTADYSIFAAGDIAEFEGRVSGLWPSAVEQAEVAAINALGGDARHGITAQETMLKVAGIYLTSIGRFEPRSRDEVVIAKLNDVKHTYRKIVIADGCIVGAIMIGHPMSAPVVVSAVKQKRDVSGDIDALKAGDWSCLARPATRGKRQAEQKVPLPA